jgi:hypothetical protein
MNSVRWRNEKLPSNLIFETQLLFLVACSTFHFFLVEAPKISGAMSLGFLPLSHGESQKGAIFPFPMEIVVEA